MAIKLITQSRLNLASGQIRIQGFFNIDRVMAPNVDYVWNLEDYPWPIESNSAIEVVCDHYIEHIPHDTYAQRLVRLIQQSDSWFDFQQKVKEIDLNTPSDGLILFMEELYRILKPGGEAKFITPYFQHESAWRDPTHVRAITESTYRYFNKEWLLVSNLEHYNINCDFDVKMLGYYYNEDIKFQGTEEKLFGTRCWWNVIYAMKVKLTKR